MLVEIINNDILVDKKKIASGFRCNLTEGRQARIKAKVVHGDEDIPVDLVLYEITPGVGIDMNVKISGEELNKKIRFDLQLVFNIISTSWKVKGKFNGITIKEKLNNFLEIIPLIKNLILKSY